MRNVTTTGKSNHRGQAKWSYFEKDHLGNWTGNCAAIYQKLCKINKKETRMLRQLLTLLVNYDVEWTYPLHLHLHLHMYL